MTDLRTAGDVSTGELLNGRYRLEERIGEGGMARVYRAHDTHLNRTTAVKVMRGPVDGPDTLERARAETRVLASLSHHSLVTVFDAKISEDDGCFIVMEYIDGFTLKDRIHAGPLDERDAAGIAVDVAEALHVAHTAGIVHRDIKPSNVLLRRSPLPGRTWHAKLADFGIAYLLDSTRVTTPGLIVGTAAYIAPEQAQGQPPAPPADIYAFGLMLIEALTGTRPYADAEGIGAVMARLVSPPEIPANLRPEWQGLLRGMTARVPEDRPTALEVATVAARLASAGTPSTVDQPTEALPVHTSPTVAMPAAGAAAAGFAAAAATETAAVAPAERAAAPRAIATPPGLDLRPRAAATVSTPTPVATASPRAPHRRRRVTMLLTAAAIVVLALAAVVWGLSVAGAVPDSDPTPVVEPPVEPSQAPSEQAPSTPVVEGNSGTGNQADQTGDQGNGNQENPGTGNSENGNQGNANGNGNQGNGNGNGNQSNGNGNTQTGTDTGTGTGTEGGDTGVTPAPGTETPAPAPSEGGVTTQSTTLVGNNGNGNGNGNGGNNGRGNG